MHRRRLAVLMTAPIVLAAAPALAQDTAPAQAAPQAAPAQAAPVQAVPDPAPVQAAPPPAAPPQVSATVPDDTAVTAASRTGASTTPVDPDAAAQAAAEDSARRRARPLGPPTARPATSRSPVLRASAPSAASAGRPAPAPVAAAPATPPPVTPPAEPAPAAPVSAAPATAGTAASADAATSVRTTTAPARRGLPIWLLAVLAALIVAGIAFVALRRRRPAEAVYYGDEPVARDAAAPMTIEPVAAAPVAAPIAAGEPAAAFAPEAAPAFLTAAPLAPSAAVETASDIDAADTAMPDDATIASADEEDLAGLTAAAPAGDRPWLEFAMRPIRGGTNVDEALVEIELTVGNAGPIAAEDVRISTFMLEAGNAGDIDRLLRDLPGDAAVDAVTIDPGEGTRVDTTLALLKSGLAHGHFRPVVVADARYRLADGSEGRTSASFLIGHVEDGSTELRAFDTAQPLMRDDVEARLYREPQHA